jgi:hypothetical protein
MVEERSFHVRDAQSMRVGGKATAAAHLGRRREALPEVRSGGGRT